MEQNPGILVNRFLFWEGRRAARHVMSAAEAQRQIEVWSKKLGLFQSGRDLPVLWWVTSCYNPSYEHIEPV